MIARRDVLKAGATALVATAVVTPRRTAAQGGNRGGTLTVRAWDPAHYHSDEIQRHLARQQYYVHTPSGVYIGVWDGALKNCGPNLGYDCGGRLTAAWLER